jgi:hypothetical protein
VITGKKHEIRKRVVDALKRQCVMDMPFLGLELNVRIYIIHLLLTQARLAYGSVIYTRYHVMETRLKTIGSKLYRWVILGN